MTNFIEKLTGEVRMTLLTIEMEEADILQRSERSIEVLEQVFVDLKDFTIGYTFPCKEEEVQFFKETKPNLFSILIYYRKLYNIEINRPKGGEEELQKYLKWQLCLLKDYFERNSDFYRYYRSGDTRMDEYYFLRQKPTIHMTMESFYFERDPRFSTPADFKMAKLIGNDRVEEYLCEELRRLKTKNEGEALSLKEKLTWTSPKVFLIELIYLLFWVGVFNHGKATLKEICSYFETIYNIDLGANVSGSFAKMQDRKNRSPFLDLLRTTFSQKMNKFDEK